MTIRSKMLPALQVLTFMLVVFSLLQTNSTFNSNTNVFPKGQDGGSAYEVWVQAGHSGSVYDFFEYLRGPAGRDGSDGTNGINGLSIEGKSGQDGKTIFTRTNPKTCEFEERYRGDLQWSGSGQIDPECEVPSG